MEMLRVNLIAALKVAIVTEGKADRERTGIRTFVSGRVQGWAEVLDALQRGEDLYIAEEPACVRQSRRELAPSEIIQEIGRELGNRPEKDSEISPGSGEKPE